MFKELFPIIYSRDIQRLVEFYHNVLGFEQHYRFPYQGQLRYAELHLGAGNLGIASKEAAAEGIGKDIVRQGSPQFELVLWVDDCDEANSYLLSNGVKQIQPPADHGAGNRVAYFEDPEGNPLQIVAKSKA